MIKKTLTLIFGLFILIFTSACPLQHPVTFIPTFDDGPLNKDLTTIERNPCPTAEEIARPLEKILTTLREQFQILTRRIESEGHIVGLHAFDHLNYQDPFFSEDAIREDITHVIAEIRAAGIEPHPVWRTPYFSHAKERETIAKELGIVTHDVDIDSLDSFTHPDSPMRDIVTPALWWKVVSSAIDHAIAWQVIPDNKLNVDMLSHVNETTAENLPRILDRVKQGYLKKYGLPAWGDSARMHWASDLEDPGLLEYIRPYSPNSR